MEERLRDHVWSLGELFSEGWSLFRAHWNPILTIVFAVYIPLFALTAGFAPSVQTPQEAWRLAPLGALATLLNLFLGTIAAAAVAFLVERAVRGEEVSWRAAFEHGKRRLLATLWTSLLAGLIVFALSLCFVIPGIIWAIYYSFIVFVVSLRGREGKAALDYSKALVQGRWFFVFSVCLLLGLAAGLVQGAVAAGLGWLPDSYFVDIFRNTLGQVVAYVFLVMEALFFLNLDYRHSGAPA